VLGKLAQLSRFAGTVESFEGEEEAHKGRVQGTGCRLQGTGLAVQARFAGLHGFTMFTSLT
jgi:hypothetical protein